MQSYTTSGDRLSFTLLFSIIIHAVILLGVGFNVFSPPQNPPKTSIDITLVKQQTDEVPEQADYLAQANKEGGGEDEKKSPDPAHETPTTKAQQTTNKSRLQQASQAMPQPVKPVSKPTNVITQQKAERKVSSQTKPTTTPKPVADITPTAKPHISATELMSQTRQEISMLEQTRDLSASAMSKKTKKRRISSSTREYAAAAYLEAWRKKVERIGNLNYPNEAKRMGLNGSLLLSVDINPDGSVSPNGIVVSRSSGHKVLDDAAVKIVRLAAPYAPIPDNVLKNNDVITIVRTWKFETDNGLFAR